MYAYGLEKQYSTGTLSYRVYAVADFLFKSYLASFSISVLFENACQPLFFVEAQNLIQQLVFVEAPKCVLFKKDSL